MAHPLSIYLNASGKTQRQFAAEVGVREATVSAWKGGVTPRPVQMQRVAEITCGALPVTTWFFPPADSETGDAA